MRRKFVFSGGTRVGGLANALVSRLARRVAQERALVRSPYLSAKFFPLEREPAFRLGTTAVVQPLVDIPAERTTLPTPPRELWEGWTDREEIYLRTGRRDMQFVLDTVTQAGEAPAEFSKVLDFGCGAGRMLRFYPSDTPGLERWGVDIKAKFIAWAQQHLSPPLSFAVTTTLPHLPFEDDYFDLVFCFSVFTHMAELADAWFLELRRVLRPGGYLFITIHDERSIELLPELYPDGELTEVVRRLEPSFGAPGSYASIAIGAEPRAQVFYRREYVLRKWKQLADLVAVIAEPGRYQTALLFRKRGAGRQ
jgi:SAM-dependent methyltransferase